MDGVEGFLGDDKGISQEEVKGQLEISGIEGGHQTIKSVSRPGTREKLKPRYRGSHRDERHGDDLSNVRIEILNFE